MLRRIVHGIPKRSHQNYFTTLNIPTGYNVDMQQLTKNVHKLQRQAHPDIGMEKTFTVLNFIFPMMPFFGGADLLCKVPGSRLHFFLDNLKYIIFK